MQNLAFRPTGPLTDDERRERTLEVIERFRRYGYQVRITGDYGFQAVRPRNPSGYLLVILSFLGVGLGVLLWGLAGAPLGAVLGLLYLAYATGRGDERKVVEIDEYGRVQQRAVAEFGFE